MSSGPTDSVETTTSAMQNPSNSRTEELKQSLTLWRHVLLPLNNLLQWKHKHDPLLIFSAITFVYILICQVNPSVLTFSSCLVLLIVVVDLLVPIGTSMLFKDENWTSADDAEYTNLCAHIAHFEEHTKSKCQSILQMRRERPTMYLMIGGIALVFMAFCGQRFDNLLLCYLIIMLACLIPGVRHQQLVPFVRQYVTNVWNKKTKA